MLDAQAGRARPSLRLPPPSAPPPVPSPGMSPATLQHPLGTVGHIRQERGSPSGRVFSLSLPPWLPHTHLTPHPLAQGQPCSCWGLPPSHTGKGPRPSATEAPRPPGDPRRVLYCTFTLFPGPGLVLGERWRHSSPSLRAGWSGAGARGGRASRPRLF